jgi:hypothetical protein
MFPVALAAVASLLWLIHCGWSVDPPPLLVRVSGASSLWLAASYHCCGSSKVQGMQRPGKVRVRVSLIWVPGYAGN